MPNKIITTHFTLSGMPQPGLTPHIDIYELDPNVPSNNPQIVTSDPLTEIGAGWYRYDFAAYDPTMNYVFSIDGGNVLPAEQRYRVGGNDSYEEDISSEIWNETLTSHTNVGSTGLALNEVKANTAALLISDTQMAALLNTILKYQRNRTKIDVSAAQLIVYDDDGTTPLTIFDLKDFSGMPSVQEVCERVPQ